LDQKYPSIKDKWELAPARGPALEIPTAVACPDAVLTLCPPVLAAEVTLVSAKDSCPVALPSPTAETVGTLAATILSSWASLSCLGDTMEYQAKPDDHTPHHVGHFHHPRKSLSLLASDLPWRDRKGA